MLFIRTFLSILLSLLIGTASLADIDVARPVQGAAPAAANASGATISFKADGADTSHTQDVAVHVQIEPLQTNKIGEATAVIQEQTDALTIISADDDHSVTTLSREPSIAQRQNFAFVKASQINDLLKRSAQKSKHIARQYSLYVKDSVQNDPVALLILTYSVGTDTIRWIHMAHMSDFARTANVIYTIATALVFSVNGKLWVRYNQPIQKRLRSLLRLREPVEGAKLDGASLGVQFLSSWVLMAALNIGRVPLMLQTSLAHANIFAALELPLLTSVVGTASGFAWSEMYARIDREVAPRTATSVTWAKNIRNVLLASFASSAMLLNYQEYGLRPWFDVAISGVLGIALYLNADKITRFLDREARSCRTVLTK